MTKTRLVSLIIATLGALGLLASFHTTAGTSTRTAPSATKGTTPPATTAPPPQGTTPSTGAPPPTTNAGNQTVEGDTISTKYGDVQAVQLPSDRARSQGISSDAGPQLRNEALRAQSARINTVSGATYTSDGYAQSLQSALDRAGLPA